MVVKNHPSRVIRLALIEQERQGRSYDKYKIRDNGFTRITVKGSKRIVTDCNKTKDFYLDQIEKANKIIGSLSSEK